MAKDSLPELELANVRAREGITDTVAEIRRRTDLPARTRLAIAKTKQRWHRDPTPLVALGVTAVAGVAAIVVGVRIRRHPAGRLDALLVPAPNPVFKPVKVGKDGKAKGVPAFSRVEDKHNPVLVERRERDARWAKIEKQAKKSRKRSAKRARKALKG